MSMIHPCSIHNSAYLYIEDCNYCYVTCLTEDNFSNALDACLLCASMKLQFTFDGMVYIQYDQTWQPYWDIYLKLSG